MTQTRDTSAAPERREREAEKLGQLARMSLFYRQVVAELRKVIWPTRKELITYTSVVIVFVGVIIGIVSLLDLGFTKAVFAVFG